MTRDERFSAAVELAKCFILNGDIRLDGKTREDSNSMMMLGDAITSLYKVVESADLNIDPEA